MQFRPLNNNVLIRRIEARAASPGGIIIPEAAQEKPQEGEVIAVGPGARGDNGVRLTPGVAPGDKVLFGRWSGSDVKFDGAEFVIMSETEILGIVEEA